MAHRLRPYQTRLKQGIYQAWSKGAVGVMAQAPTGAGKTEVMQDIAGELDGMGLAFAHRKELIGQIAMAFARSGIEHDIIAPKETRNKIVRKQMQRLGRTTYNPNASWLVASVDSFNARGLDPTIAARVPRIKNAFVDEGHHVQQTNKWGRALAQLTEVERLLLVSATPGRPDKKGLGSWNDGVCDALIEGPQMRTLINEGYLCDYQLATVWPSDLNLAGVEISETTGEFNPKQLAERIKQSKRIIGDIVDTYVRNARGETAICFAVDLEHGAKIVQQFLDAGVPAVLVSGESTPAEREDALERLEDGHIHVVVNVDLFGEGFDLPNVKVVIMARPTASFITYAQQFGRVLRLLISALLMGNWDLYNAAQRLAYIATSEKPFGKVFDHVGNIYRFEGPPDKPRVWSLEPGYKRKRSANDAIPLRMCFECFKKCEAFHTNCPHCGHEFPAPGTMGSSAIEVDGDLRFMSAEFLSMMRGEVHHIDGPAFIPQGRPDLEHIVRKRHQERQIEQHYLRKVINLWAATYADVNDATNYKRFFLLFGMDVVSACALGVGDARALRSKIEAEIIGRGIVITV